MTDEMNPTPVPPAPPSGPPPARSPIRRAVILILLAVGSLLTLVLLGGGGYALYLYWQYMAQQKAQTQKVQERELRQLQLQKALQARVEDIRQNGTALPPCPLLYPLLNEKGKATPLGSFLSFYAMRQATYLPQSVFQLPDSPVIFDNFDLFQEKEIDPSAYRDQLPYYFGSKEFGEGTLRKTSKGYRIKLRFWGDRPGKKYQKNFKKKDLNKAPGWMAACIQNYAGFQPALEQAAYRDQPVFGDGDDFLLAAAEEKLFRSSGTKLVLHWDRILAKNPENPYLVARKVYLLTALDYNNYLDYLEPLARKQPDSTYFHYVLANEYNTKKKYDQALDICFAELKRDDNNPMWYDVAETSLEWKGDWINAYQLLKNWAAKYPGNPKAWVMLGYFLKGWAWDARGSDLAVNVPKAAWPIFKKRINEGYGYAQKATQVAPGFWLTWDTALGYGNGAELEDTIVRNYFEHARKLNPISYHPYSILLDHLKPKWSGSEEDMMDFAQKYSDLFPYLMVEAAAENMEWDDQLKTKKILSPETQTAYRKSLDWPLYQKYTELYLRKWPYDLDTWYSYAIYAEQAGALDKVIQYARQMAGENPELEALPAMVAASESDAHYWNLDSNFEKSAYWMGQDRFKVIAAESLQMRKLDPENWYWPNRAICFLMHTSQVDAAVKEYKYVGEAHWDPTVCEKSDWETVKGWAIATPTAVPAVSMPHQE